ncbi:hypothetical protein SDRG_04024 [Saprolegnia diclina VS20]|uniref:Uncharacterized protein n=1 Tax=Saprolegnia diclina (strain VS20) TaxID=1156394 RepID=T0QJT5_SAPDV|nr:hypothetical protein SDRG_04024 [Saprolegnia diclina VS20]EQC38304.1 hypothetical protein SDRG_04024 [Saprolegnia diclina VS20]|eukprot:XP_008607896.1 hypothetical protein SDRG_04024 [Saprolegnia diclina VS20]
MAANTYATALATLERSTQFLHVDSILPCFEPLLDAQSATATDDAVIANIGKWSHVLSGIILPKIKKALGVPASLDIDAVFSHLSVDDIGISDVLIPTVHPRAFGSLLVFLPTPYDGGAVSFASSDMTKVYTSSMKAGGCDAMYAATLAGTNVSSAPITHGRRTTLVYSLVSVASDAIFRPPTYTEAMAAFHHIAAKPMAQTQRVAYFVPSSVVSFEDLAAPAANLARLLVLSNAFDVTITRITKHRVTHCFPHPSCATPDSVVTGLAGRTVHACLNDPNTFQSRSCEGPRTALLFWPKQYRAGIVGVNAAMSLLRDGSCLGLPSCRDLLLGTMAIFKTIQCTTVNATPTSLIDDIHSPSLLLEPLAHLVLASNDWSIAEIFIQDILRVANNYEPPVPWADIGRILHGCLTKFTWPTLYGALEHLVTWWSATLHVDAVVHLLASLAGVAPHPLCHQLSQPFVAECIKACWSVVSQHAKKIQGNTAASILLVDWYLDEMVQPTQPPAHWLDAFLPRSVITLVDNFLYARQHGASTLLALCGDAATRLEVLPLALVRATESCPSIPWPLYVAAIKQAIHAILAPSRVKRVSTSACSFILQCMVTAGLCDTALFDALETLCGMGVFECILEFLERQSTPVAPWTQSLISTFVLTKTHLLVRASAKPVAAAFLSLRLVAPGTIATFATAWLGALPTTLDANRTILAPVILMLQDLLGGNHRDVLMQMVKHSLATFECSGALNPVPAITDFVLDDIATDPTHCRDCAALSAFLRDGAETQFTASIHICALVPGVVEANARRLRLRERRVPRGRPLRETVIWKLQRPGGASVQDLKLRIKQQALHTKDVEHWMQLEALLHGASEDDTKDDDTAAPSPKRLRLE